MLSAVSRHTSSQRDEVLVLLEQLSRGGISRRERKDWGMGSLEGLALRVEDEIRSQVQVHKCDFKSSHQGLPVAIPSALSIHLASSSHTDDPSQRTLWCRRVLRYHRTGQSARECNEVGSRCKYHTSHATHGEERALSHQSHREPLWGWAQVPSSAIHSLMWTTLNLVLS